MRQFGVALALGDEGLAYRCRLYLALSLIQKGKLRKAKKYIRYRPRFAITSVFYLSDRILKIVNHVRNEKHLPKEKIC